MLGRTLLLTMYLIAFNRNYAQSCRPPTSGHPPQTSRNNMVCNPPRQVGPPPCQPSIAPANGWGGGCWIPSRCELLPSFGESERRCGPLFHCVTTPPCHPIITAPPRCDPSPVWQPKFRFQSFYDTSFDEISVCSTSSICIAIPKKNKRTHNSKMCENQRVVDEGDKSCKCAYVQADINTTCKCITAANKQKNNASKTDANCECDKKNKQNNKLKADGSCECEAYLKKRKKSEARKTDANCECSTTKNKQNDTHRANSNCECEVHLKELKKKKTIKAGATCECEAYLKELTKDKKSKKDSNYDCSTSHKKPKNIKIRHNQEGECTCEVRDKNRKK